MLKKILFLFAFLFITSCAQKAGEIPEGVNPTLTEKYVIAGQFFDNSKVEKLGFSDFAKSKCVQNGYKGFKGYSVSGYSEGWYIFNVLPLTDVIKTVKVWCK
jgi:hypothetical protein